MAEAYDVAVAPHCPLGPIALSACLHMDACTPNAFIQEQSLGIHYNQGSDLLDYLKDPKVFDYSDGVVKMPTGPGLGIEVNEELVIEKAKKTVARVIKKYDGTSNVYLIKMFDTDGDYVFLKGGKADDITKRLRDLSRQEYKRDNVQIDRVEIIKTWELPNSHLAESFEQALHAYLCNFFDNIPNDRYYPKELTAEQFAELDRRHEIICSFA